MHGKNVVIKGVSEKPAGHLTMTAGFVLFSRRIHARHGRLITAFFVGVKLEKFPDAGNLCSADLIRPHGLGSEQNQVGISAQFPRLWRPARSQERPRRLDIFSLHHSTLGTCPAPRQEARTEPNQQANRQYPESSHLHSPSPSGRPPPRV